MQISQPSVKYLGFELSKGQINLPPVVRRPKQGWLSYLKKIIAGIPRNYRVSAFDPQFWTHGKTSVWDFKGVHSEPWLGLLIDIRFSRKPRENQVTAPALELPDFKETLWPFHTCETRDTTGGVNTNYGNTKWLVTYFSETLDIITYGPPTGLRAIAAPVHCYSSLKVSFGTMGGGTNLTLCAAARAEGGQQANCRTPWEISGYFIRKS